MNSFILKRDYIFSAPVTVQVPGEGERQFTADFRLLPKSEQDRLINDDRAFLASVVQAVRDIDIDDDVIPEGRTVLDVLLDLDFCVIGLVNAYFTGRAQTLEKN